MKQRKPQRGLTKQNLSMAMTPQEQERFERLETLVDSLLKVENVPFIENGQRRIARPILGESIQKESTGGTSGVLQSVDEAGIGTYSVAKAFTGTITIEDADGNTFKLGHY